MRGRGDTGQIQRAEALRAQIEGIEKEIHGLKVGLMAVMDNLGVSVPSEMQMNR